MRIILIFITVCFYTGSCIAQAHDSLSKSSCLRQELFKDDEILQICLQGEIRELFKDRGENANYHPIRFSYQRNDSTFHLKIRVKTRGHYRKLRENCFTPPLLLNFDTIPKHKNSLFYGQNKLKLVTSCKSEQYILREYMVYKLYQFISPYHFKARLVKLCFEDTKKGKRTKSEYGILLESPKFMAERNKSNLVKTLHVNPMKTDRELFLKMAVFQSLIGNTDWSIQYLHNIKLIGNLNTTDLIPIPYDFDMSGIVNTFYAMPAEALQLKSVRERLFRGYCIKNMKEFQPILEHFIRLKSDIYNLYQTDLLLDKTYKKNTLKYIDQFYKIITDEKLSQRAFQHPCNPKGTGNIVIKGLKKHSSQK